MSTTAAPAAPRTSGWSITARPVGKNEDGENESHMLVMLRHTQGTEQEIARVAFERKFADKDYRKMSFDEKLDEELEKALKGVQVLDELVANGGKLV